MRKEESEGAGEEGGGEGAYGVISQPHVSTQTRK